MVATAFLGERTPGELAALACTPHSTESADVWSVIDSRYLGTLPLGTPDDLAEAGRRARAAQPAWAAMPPYFRLAAFRRFTALLEAYRALISELLRAESALDPQDAGELLTRAGQDCRALTRAAVRSLRPVKHRDGLRVRAVEVRNPKGLVGIVPDPAVPFDPVTATAALVAGNAVVLVPALRGGFTALLMAELLAASRLPNGLVQVVPGRPDLVQAAATEVDHLVVSGAAADGRRLAEACEQRGIGLSLGRRTDPLEFTTPATLARR